MIISYGRKRYLMKKKRITIIASVVLALMLTLTMSVATAFADTDEEMEKSLDQILNEQAEGMPTGQVITDPIGNVFSGSKSVTGEIEKDFYWAGYTLNCNHATIAYDAIIAGATLNLENVSVGGSLRAAGRDVNVTGATVEHNATLAGENVTLAGGAESRVEGLYMAGKNVTMSGRCDYFRAAAKTVILDGIVKGDAKIDGENVYIGENAVVTGTLYIEASEKPEIPSGAQIGNLEFTKEVYTNEDNDVRDFGFGFSIYSVFTALVLGAFFCLVMKKALNQSGEMILIKPVILPVTGLVSLVAVPFACILLMITVIGIPLGLILGGLYAIILVTAVPFTGASVGRIVLPKMNPWLSSLIGVLGFAILAQIPYLKILVILGAMFYALGYFIQVIYLQISGKSHQAPKSPNGPDFGGQNPHNDAPVEYTHVE